MTSTHEENEGTSSPLFDKGMSQYFRLITRALGDIVFGYDHKQGRISWLADVGSEILDYEPGEFELQPDTFNQMVHPDERAMMADVFGQLSTEQLQELEVRLKRKDNSYCWVHVDLASVEPGDGSREPIMVGMLRKTQGLHEAKEAQADGRRLKTIGTMAGGIAHEFNNHLTPVRGYIEMAIDDLDEDHPASASLKIALDRVQYCTELVGQIQAYGQKSLLVPEPTELFRLMPTFIRVAMSMYRETSEKVSLEENFPENFPRIWVDRSKFQEAIVHLIQNAMEAMPTGGTLSVMAETYDVSKHASQQGKKAGQGEFVCLSIHDTGTGIAPEHLEHIFEPFYTTRGLTKARGMGLPMVQGMIAQHGGWMEIHTDIDKGTEVRLFFPVKEEEASATPEPDEVNETMNVLPAAPVGKMLVADDEELIRDMVCRVFRDDGWDVSKAEDNHQVLEVFSKNKNPCDLLILDLTMPGPTAEETLREITIIKPNLKVLLISGFGRDDRIERLLKMGDVSYVGKPFSPKDLLTRVDRMMAITGGKG